MPSNSFKLGSALTLEALSSVAAGRKARVDGGAVVENADLGRAALGDVERERPAVDVEARPGRARGLGEADTRETLPPLFDDRPGADDDVPRRPEAAERRQKVGAGGEEVDGHRWKGL